MNKKNIIRISIFLFVIIAIAGLIIRHNILKQRLRETIINERRFTGQSIEENLPDIIINDTDYLNSAVATVDFEDKTQDYKKSDGKPGRYYEWNDNIKLECEASNNFNFVPPKMKLQFFKDLSAKVVSESYSIKTNMAPTYAKYSSEIEIVDVFDAGVFCNVNVEIHIKAGNENYTYYRYSYHISEVYHHNGVEEPKEIYTQPSQNTNKTSPKTDSTNNNPKNNKKYSNNKKYERLDSYDEGYEDVYLNGDYDWDRYCNDWDYASGVDDALDDEGLDY